MSLSNYQTKYRVIKNGKDGLKTTRKISSPDDITGNIGWETTCFALNRWEGSLNRGKN